MSLEIVMGPMFSGKSSTIHSAVKRQTAIGVPVLAIKPAIDTRYDGNAEVVTHDNLRIPCLTVNSLDEIPLVTLAQAKFIVIEEAQFFERLVSFVLKMVDIYHKDVLVVGLDGDSDRKPFGEILQLIPYAESVIKLNALCSRCRNGTKAPFTYRKTSDDTQIHVGDQSDYQAVCRSCYHTLTRKDV
jgi:thymidine kinase